jgi:hypothetical protein
MRQFWKGLNFLNFGTYFMKISYPVPVPAREPLKVKRLKKIRVARKSDLMSPN